jgi:hypothetical protein
MVTLACILAYPCLISFTGFIVFAFWIDQKSEMDKAIEETEEYIKRNKKVLDRIQ